MKRLAAILLLLPSIANAANQCTVDYGSFINQIGTFLEQNVDNKLAFVQSTVDSFVASSTAQYGALFSSYAVLDATLASSTIIIGNLTADISVLNTDIGQLTVKYESASSTLGTLSSGLDIASSTIAGLAQALASSTQTIDQLTLRFDYASSTIETLIQGLATASSSLAAAIDLLSAGQATTTAETLQSIISLQASSTDHELRITNLENMTYVPPGSAGSADKVEKSITQTAHGFTAGQWVYLSAASTYALADNDLPTTADSIGVVTAVADANTFTLQTSGYVTGLTGLTATAAHFLSSTAGAITATEPTGTSQTRKPVLIADTTTSGWVIDRTGTPVTGQTAVTNSGENTSITDGQTTTSTSYVDVTGSSFTLPVAGTYAVFYTVSTANSTATADTQYSLADNTNTLVPNSEYKVRAASGGNNVVLTSSRILITTTGAATYKLRWKVDAGTATLTNTSAGAEASGSKISWVQIGGTPISMSLAGEYGQSPMTEGAQISSTSFADFNTNQTVTVPTAGVWSITYIVNGSNQTADTFASFQVLDVTNGNTVVSGSNSRAIRGTSSQNSTAVQTFQVTTTGANTYKLQGAVSVNTFSISNDQIVGTGGGESKWIYQKISGFTPTTGQTVDYVQATYTNTGGINISAADSVIPLDTVVSGNIPLASNRFTLTAGKTYRLVGVIPYGGSGSPNIDTQFYNVTAGAYIGSTRSSVLTATLANTGYNEAIFTPSVTTEVEFRLRATAGGSYTLGAVDINRQQGPNVTITQLGSTSNTVGSLPAVDQSATGYFDIGNMRIQWGKTASVGDTDQTITFPVAFATPPSVTCSTEITTGTNAAYGTGLKTITTTSFLANRDDTISDADGPFFNWHAIGMKP